MQLIDNDPFRTIDNKHPVLGHQRQGTKKNFLLFDIANRLNPCFLINIKSNKAHGNLDRDIIGHAPFNAFFDGIFGLTKCITDKLQGTESVKIGKRKNILKDCLQAKIFPRIRVNILLQKTFIRMSLHGD